MKEPVWNKFLTEADKELWQAGGYDARQGFGARPAILVIDVNYAFTGDRREGFVKHLRHYVRPTSWVAQLWRE